jgi:hypothetical protein
MTIDDVMSLIDEAIAKTMWAMRANFDAEPDEQTQWAHVEHKKDIARRGILALLDAEAEACAGVCDHIGNKPTEAYVDPFDCATAIRARIAERKQTEPQCETCEGRGFFDERLTGWSFDNPKAKCPDCDGKGWIAGRKGGNDGR